MRYFTTPNSSRWHTIELISISGRRRPRILRSIHELILSGPRQAPMCCPSCRRLPRKPWRSRQQIRLDLEESSASTARIHRVVGLRGPTTMVALCQLWALMTALPPMRPVSPGNCSCGGPDALGCRRVTRRPRRRWSMPEISRRFRLITSINDGEGARPAEETDSPAGEDSGANLSP